MPNVGISEKAFRALARRAAALNISVEEFVAASLEQVAAADSTNSSPSPEEISDEQWKSRFAQFLATARNRASRYPHDFQANVSRECMYEGCGE